jgi:oxygen-independent coproporphyrinogen-3 oxidase
VGRPAGELPLQRGHVLSGEDRQIRALLWTLFAGSPAVVDEPVRTAGWWQACRPALVALQRDGLIELTADRIRVTTTGRAFLRRIGCAFDRYLAQPSAMARMATL